MFYQLEHLGTADEFKKEQGENFSYPPHLHRSFELILVDAGEMTVTVDRKRYSVARGDGVLIFPNQVHSMESTHSRHTLFIFSPRIIQAYYTEKAGRLPVNNAFSLPMALREALGELSPERSKYCKKGLLYTVCDRFEGETEFYEVAADKQDLLFRILTYTEQNFQRDCSLAGLATAVGYNPEYVSRFFKKKMGIGYHHYLNARRLNHAAYLLTNTDQSCLYCALESGYASLRSFNRNFKAHFGCTPQEYKGINGENRRS